MGGKEFYQYLNLTLMLKKVDKRMKRMVLIFFHQESKIQVILSQSCQNWQLIEVRQTIGLKGQQ